MNIITNPTYYALDAINYIESKYNVKYIFESCIKGKEDWLSIPSLIFYSKKRHPEGSNYLAVTKSRGQNIILSNGESATEPFSGIIADNGDIIYSHYKHHFNESEDKSVWIDGGRNYTRTNNVEKLIRLIVICDKVIVSEEVKTEPNE